MTLPRRRGRAFSGFKPPFAGAPLGSQQNLLLHSEDLTNAAWTKVLTATPGTNDLDVNGIHLTELASDGNSDFCRVQQSIGELPAGSHMTVSAFIYPGASVQTAIRIDDAGTNRCTVPIDWNAGVPTLGTPAVNGLQHIGSSIQALGDDLYRVAMTARNPTAGALTMQILCYEIFSTLPGSASNAYWGGVQAELGELASAYIRTTSAAVQGQ